MSEQIKSNDTAKGTPENFSGVLLSCGENGFKGVALHRPHTLAVYQHRSGSCILVIKENAIAPKRPSMML